MARHITNLTGVIYRDCITNGKADKVYYIRYKDKNKKTIELKIGKELSVTRERVRQIESSAIKKLKHPKVGKNLKNYVES